MYTLYQVLPGDTMDDLAIRFKTSTETLRKANNLPFDYQLNPKEQIIVPGSNTKSYIVEEGDTLYKVCNRLDTDFNTLIENNDKIYLLPGYKLIIKDKSAPYM